LEKNPIDIFAILISVITRDNEASRNEKTHQKVDGFFVARTGLEPFCG